MYTTLTWRSFPIADVSGFKQKVLNWLRSVNTFCFLDNQHYDMPSHGAELLVGAGVREWVEGTNLQTADPLFENAEWLFGHLSYELTYYLHHLPSAKKEKIGFPPFYFFLPEVVLQLKGSVLTVYAPDPVRIREEIEQAGNCLAASPASLFAAQPVLSKEAYVEKIKALQAHILRGDCYEINFCQEFFATDTVLEPFAAFARLMQVSPNPFSALYRLNEKFLLCASPERFLTKKGTRILSQPIKGTIQRDLSDAAHDADLKTSLRLSPKEQAENVMVVDLVRNDLVRICQPATVQVDELFGAYSFPQVHQLISTVSGELKDHLLFSQIMEACFPMGSMTGAPKRRVMELIEEHEPSARGIFSGSVGYKTPDGDFDFNVVIRSIMYNREKGMLSYQVGSGITFYSDAEKEWEECMLKAEAIRKVLS